MAGRRPRRYVVCIANEGYTASLERRKIYLMVADSQAEQHGLVRVVDESGEDYLFPKACFAEISLPREIEQALALR